jgi:hypothetical protein
MALTAAETRVKFIKFHADQARIYRAIKGQKRARIVMRAGRRYGKTTMLEEMAANWAIKGEKVGWFCPNYKLLAPSYKRILKRVKELVISASRTDGLIELEGGGSIEFWTLNNPDAGRSRHYDRVIIDEAGLVLKGLKEIFEQAIEPTLLDTGGSCYVAGTPKGATEESWFYEICTDKSKGWTEFHIPTKLNPHLNEEALAELREKTDPDVHAQEYEAIFIDWRGKAFFALPKWLDADSLPFDYPKKCDIVFAVIDSAVKDGKEHDGTAVTYFARTFHGDVKMIILDWDIIQIEGAILETWLPSVYARLEQLAELCGARQGAMAPHIEDKASGTILLQQAKRHGWKANPIRSDLVAAGKDGRGFTASGYHFRGEIKISKYAHDKQVRFKGVTKNHLISQVMGYRMGDPESAKRPDDLYDTYVYGVSIGLGNQKGH